VIGRPEGIAAVRETYGETQAAGGA
jgi:hypothetical protein